MAQFHLIIPTAALSQAGIPLTNSNVVKVTNSGTFPVLPGNFSVFALSAGVSGVVTAQPVTVIESASYTAGSNGTPPTISVNDGATDDLSTNGPWTLYMAFSASPITLSAAQIAAATPTTGVTFSNALYNSTTPNPIIIDKSAQGSIYGSVVAGNGTILSEVVTISDVNIADATPPYALTFSPSSSATEVPTNGNFVVTFDTPIFAGVGSITFGGVSVNIGACTISGNTLTIPYTGLTASTSVTPTWPAGLVTDASGNKVAALVNEVSFTTATAALSKTYLGSTPSADRGTVQNVGGAYDAAGNTFGINGLVTGQTLIVMVHAIDANAITPLTVPNATVTHIGGSFARSCGIDVYKVVLTADATASSTMTAGVAVAGGDGNVISGYLIEGAANINTSILTADGATNSTTPVTVSLPVTEGGLIIAGATSYRQAAGSFTFAGVTFDQDYFVTRNATDFSRHSAVASANVTTTGNTTVSAYNNDQIGLAAVAISPL